MTSYPPPPKRPSAHGDVPAEVYTGRRLHGLMEERRVGAEGPVRTGGYLAVDLAAVSVAGLDERVAGRFQLEKLVWEQLRPCGEIHTWMYQRDTNYQHLVVILVGFVEVEAARRAYMINGYEYDQATSSKLAIRRRTYFPNNWGFLAQQEASKRRDGGGRGFKSVLAARERQQRYPIATNPSLPIAPPIRSLLPFLDPGTGAPYPDVQPFRPRMSREEYCRTRPNNDPEIISWAHGLAWRGPTYHFFDDVEDGRDLSVCNSAHVPYGYRVDFDKLCGRSIQDDTVSFLKDKGYAWATAPATPAQKHLLTIPLDVLRSAGMLPSTFPQDWMAEEEPREVRTAMERRQSVMEWHNQRRKAGLEYAKVNWGPGYIGVYGAGTSSQGAGAIGRRVGMEGEGRGAPPRRK